MHQETEKDMELDQQIKSLQVKSGTVSWETLSTAGSILTTQGDIFDEDASGLARLGFGTSGDVLTTKGTGANPVWETPTGATTAIQRIVLSSSFNTSSSSFTDVTGMTVTLPDNSGHSFLSFQISCDMNVGTGSMAFRLVDDTTNLAGISLSIATSAIAHIVVYPYVASNDGQAVKLQAKCSANNIDINSGAELSSEISVLNVS